MKLFEALTEKPIILVFGRLCSGKGHYCSPFTKQGYAHTSASSVARKLSGKETRGGLQNTAQFGPAIAEELIDFINRNDKAIIDGIRQKIIVDELVDHFGHENIEMVWLDVPDHIRKDRFDTRSDDKDDQSFDAANRGDARLGIDDIENAYRQHSTVVQHY
jgi:dephospho-CoA kinase